MQRKSESRQGCSADCKTLADCRGRIADSIQGIGNLPDTLVLVGHLGNSPGIVCDRSIGIDRKGDPQCREHADPGNCYPI